MALRLGARYLAVAMVESVAGERTGMGELVGIVPVKATQQLNCLISVINNRVQCKAAKIIKIDLPF
jgi:hypothetical protein